MSFLDVCDILIVKAGQLRDNEVFRRWGDRCHCGSVQFNGKMHDTILPSWRQSGCASVNTIYIKAMSLVKHGAPTEQCVDLFRGLIVWMFLFPS